MMTIQTTRNRRGLVSVAVALLAVSLTACIDELLEVTDPEIGRAHV